MLCEYEEQGCNGTPYDRDLTGEDRLRPPSAGVAGSAALHHVSLFRARATLHPCRKSPHTLQSRMLPLPAPTEMPDGSAFSSAFGAISSHGDIAAEEQHRNARDSDEGKKMLHDSRRFR